MGEAVRARVVFRGNVQGVGFRYTTRHVASAFQVTGYVENEPDGTVELVAEGNREEIQAFIDAVTERMQRYIGDTDVQWSPAQDEFDAFGVRFAW